MDRRRVLMASVAGVAAVAGAAAAWWRLRLDEPLPAAEAAFWTTPWTGSDGQAVDLQGYRGQPLLLNFWATWCPPCVEELPLLNRFYAQQKAVGWHVVGLAVDQPSAVRQFLQKVPLDFPVVMGGLGGTDLSKQLGNASGGLPFTALFDARGRVTQRKLGQLKPDDLAAWAAL